MLTRLFETVFHEKVQVVALVKDLALDVRIKLSQPSHLPVLLSNELLIESGYLDVEIILWEIEVGSEPLSRNSVAIPFDIEGTGLVSPFDLVEVQELSKLSLGVVSEIFVLVGKPSVEVSVDDEYQSSPRALLSGFEGASSAGFRNSETEACTSSITGRTAMPKTPCPFRSRSITSLAE